MDRGETIRHPQTGMILHRDVRDHIVRYQGLSETIQAPGWYAEDPSLDKAHAILSPGDCEIINRTFHKLKARLEAAASTE